MFIPSSHFARALQNRKISVGIIQSAISTQAAKMVKLILLNLLFLLGAVHVNSQNTSQKVVCYYDSRAFGKEGEKPVQED